MKETIFNNIFKDGDNILYIPIVSMRSYEDNKYDLSCDGNVNRFVSNFLNLISTVKCNIKIVLPDESNVTEAGNKFIDKFKKYAENQKGNIEIIRYKYFPIGGASVERSLDGSKKIIKEINYYLNDYNDCNFNYIIYESNCLGITLETLKPIYNYKTIYWCPVSCTDNLQPEFLKEYQFIDIQLAKSCDYLIVASNNQVLYFSKYKKENLIQNDCLIDLNLDIFKYQINKELLNYCNKLDGQYDIIYFPFRLTDKGYNLNLLKQMITNLYARLGNNIPLILFYSDPNDSGLLDDFNLIKTYKCPKDRNSYYTMINQVNCVVPYFESNDDILHASWQEMKTYQTKVFIYDNKKSIEDNIDNLIFKFARSPLYILEGFDRVGKDTQLLKIKENINHLTEIEPSLKVYIQDPNRNPPFYRKNEFKEWLNNYLNNQSQELIDFSFDENNSKRRHPIIMTRLFLSDYVYGHLFNRQPIAEKYRNYLKRYFRIINIVLLWKNKNEYHQRCIETKDKIEYTNEEFDKINKLFLQGLNKVDKIIYITNDMSIKDIYKKITKILIVDQTKMPG